MAYKKVYDGAFPLLDQLWKDLFNKYSKYFYVPPVDVFGTLLDVPKVVDAIKMPFIHIMDNLAVIGRFSYLDLDEAVRLDNMRNEFLSRLCEKQDLVDVSMRAMRARRSFQLALAREVL